MLDVEQRRHHVPASWYSPNTRRSASAISPSVARCLDGGDDRRDEIRRRLRAAVSTASSAVLPRHRSLRLAADRPDALDLLRCSISGSTRNTACVGWA